MSSLTGFGFSDQYTGKKNLSKEFSMEENDESTEDSNKQIAGNTGTLLHPAEVRSMR